MQYMGLCFVSLSISLLVLFKNGCPSSHLINIIKSKVWIISNCLWLDDETMEWYALHVLLCSNEFYEIELFGEKRRTLVVSAFSLSPVTNMQHGYLAR